MVFIVLKLAGQNKRKEHFTTRWRYKPIKTIKLISNYYIRNTNYELRFILIRACCLMLWLITFIFYILLVYLYYTIHITSEFRVSDYNGHVNK